ncbi:hypothetical protein ACFH04_01095 [Streptomyces noboritoensis]|uniref:Uncharacterized protein n=1 Tax=Streptomyces noboritoensis TaxID=67337 RepID=A0ABV6T984_9ACTN
MQVQTQSSGNPQPQSRRIAQIKLPDGSETTAYIPRGVKGAKEGSPVLIRDSRGAADLPDVWSRVAKVENRVRRRKLASDPAWYQQSHKGIPR